MRKQSRFLCNQSGFFLPYVLGITVIIIFATVTHINLYQQDIKVTHQHLEQLKIETLIQMGYQKFQEEYPVVDSDQFEVGYSFPHGTVNLRYKTLGEMDYNLHVDVLTFNNSAFATYRMIKHEKNE